MSDHKITCESCGAENAVQWNATLFMCGRCSRSNRGPSFASREPVPLNPEQVVALETIRRSMARRQRTTEPTP
jgi:hypothetical protein